VLFEVTIAVDHIDRESCLVSRTIVEDVIVPVAAPSHAICKVRKPTMQHLSQHPWILQPDNVLPRQWIDQAFDRAGLPRPQVLKPVGLVLRTESPDTRRLNDASTPAPSESLRSVWARSAW